jgi:hypothetical protein
MTKITIAESVMSKQTRKKAENSRIQKFKRETIHFDDLGYPSRVSTRVFLEDFDYPLLVRVDNKNITTRELNKFKGRKLKEVM